MLYYSYTQTFSLSLLYFVPSLMAFFGQEIKKITYLLGLRSTFGEFGDNWNMFVL